MNLRMIGLGAAVVCATLLPIVALASQASGPGPGTDSSDSASGPRSGPDAAQAADSGGPRRGHGEGEGDRDAKPRADGGLLPGLGLGGSERAAKPAPPTAPPSSPEGSPGTSSVPGPASGVPARSSYCGPELTSPDGIEAQTCVLTEGPDTWARTYYRNAGGQRLDAVLTLMGPAGRTVQVRCAVVARDEPGACETPRERARGAVSAYSAVAEFAGAGEGSSTPLLLRAGSNTAGAGGS